MGSFRQLMYTAWWCCLLMIQITVIRSATISSPKNASATTPSATAASTAQASTAQANTTQSLTTQAATTTTTSISDSKGTTSATPKSTQTQSNSSPKVTTTTTTIKATTAAETFSTAANPTSEASNSTIASTSSPSPTQPSTTAFSPSPTQPSTTAKTPSIGENCSTFEDLCNKTIAGAVQCVNGTCQCKEGHFPSDKAICTPENDLLPTEIQISANTSSFNVSWSHKDSVNNLDLDYNVIAKPVDNDNDISLVCCNFSTGNTTYICRQLSPGYMYSVTITVTYNSSHSVKNSTQESTFPSMPGPLDKTSSNFTYPNVTLIWESSEGRVENYLVTVFKNDSREEVYNQTTMGNVVHVNNLQASTYYGISIKANSHGKPSLKRNDTFNTAPDPVTNISVEALNATSVKVSWITSNENFNTSKYEVTTNNMVDNSPSNQSCLVIGRNVSECIVSGLEEFWVYSFNISVSARNTTSSVKTSKNVTTEEGIPGNVTNVSFKLFNSSNNCDATKVKVNWEEPDLRKRNSNITKYVLHVDKDTVKDDNESNPYRPQNKKFDQEISNLKPQSDHAIKIYAVSSTGLKGKEYIVGHFKTGVCAPPPWNSIEVERLKKAQSTPSSLTIHVPKSFFNKNAQGRITEKGFIVLHTDSDFFQDTSDMKPNEISGWSSSKDKNFQVEFKIKVEGDIQSESFEIGKDQCSSTFCNGPLPEQFIFKIAAYACTTEQLCRVSSPVGAFTTSTKPPESADSPSALVIVLAVLMVLLAVLAAFSFLWYKDYIDPASWFSKKTNDDDDGPFTPLDNYVKNRPIKICNYVSELEEMHKDTNLILSDQYDDINKFGQMIAERSTTEAARHENNTPKNRWVNILPFDHSRVKLQQTDEDEPTSDYINANYMPGFNNKREYIATQGPLPGTIDDFWRMVWEHGVSVIVMLTQCKEGNRVKCEKYWPDELREPKQYGDVVVNPVSISQLDKYNISIFEVSLYDETRQVIHFHYLDFPDFSANVEFDHFINFVRTVRSHVPRDMKGPMVIHCSAGVGRTGTFIATDRLHLYLSSDKFSEEDEVDIYGMVISMRENRVAMVQTESQYIMIHDCFEKMLEEKRASLKETDSDENPDENLYENQGFDPYPETLYENVSSQEQTEL